MFSKKSFKIILIGQCSVGKSSIIYRLCHNKFGGVLDPTIGCAFNRKKIRINDNDIALNCWDTAGQERFKSIVPMYFKDAHGIIITFDVTDLSSFEQLKTYWLPLIIEYYKDKKLPKIIVAANKMDLVTESFEVTKINKHIDNDIAELSDKYDIELICFKTSAFTGVNIEKMFKILASRIVDEYDYEVEEDDFFTERNVIATDTQPYLSCCWGSTTTIDDNQININ